MLLKVKMQGRANESIWMARKVSRHKKYKRYVGLTHKNAAAIGEKVCFAVCNEVSMPILWLEYLSGVRSESQTPQLLDEHMSLEAVMKNSQ